MDDAKLKEKRSQLKLLHKDRRLAKLAEREEMLAPYLAAQPPQEVLESIQYKHSAVWGRTYAVQAPTITALFAAAQSLLCATNNNTTAYVVLQYGVSKLNPHDKDQYDREVGRVVSASKLAAVNAYVKSVWVDGKETAFKLEHDKIEFNFMLTHGKLYPFLMYVTDSKCRTFYNEQVNAIHGDRRKIY